MGLLHRKLTEDPINSTVSHLCQIWCVPGSVGNLCPQICLDLKACPKICLYAIPSLLSPPPPPPSVSTYLDEQSNKHHLKISPFLIATITFLAAAFLFVCCYAIYSRYYLGRREDSRRRRPQPQTVETQDEFLDEEDGPVLDHPIWYIRTVGLQPSIIGSIAVCKYKRGEGLVEGAECSVCLNEFEEDETLRLLPKCSHAFHVHCIDTWLRSHTNCPMCRAPIVKNTVLQTPPPEANVNTSSPGEETPAGISQSGSASDGQIDDEVRELRIEIEDEGELVAVNDGKVSENSNQDVNDFQPMRRSVSLDSLSASKISFAVANRVPMDSHRNSHNQGVKVNESNTRIVPKRLEGNRNSLKSVDSSSKGRALTNRPVSMKRSFSWNGKFLLFNYSQSRDLVIRSF